MKTKDFDPKKAMSLREIFSRFPETDITCAICGKKHSPDRETFFTFWGNVTVGLSGGVIGNNFDERGRLGRITFICRDEKCMSLLVKYTIKRRDDVTKQR
jgi:hypothetical protein